MILSVLSNPLVRDQREEGANVSLAAGKFSLKSLPGAFLHPWHFEIQYRNLGHKHGKHARKDQPTAKNGQGRMPHIGIIDAGNRMGGCHQELDGDR